MIFKSQQELRAAITLHKTLQEHVGFVPTMGALHQGHLSLVEKALEDNALVVVSIFVNPTQFDNASDLENYPRTLEKDAALLRNVSDNIYIYAPTATDLYGEKVVSKRYNFKGLEDAMEGQYRDGHFDGVGTVLNLLFRAIRPQKAYFGEKDFQQLQVVRKLVEIEKLPVTIIGCPILRESNGLAMSSRNKRLTPLQLDEAAIIYETLVWVNKNFNTKSISKLQSEVDRRFKENNQLTLEYFEIADVKTLKTAYRKRQENTYRAFIAAYAGDVRLIDNMKLPKIYR